MRVSVFAIATGLIATSALGYCPEVPFGEPYELTDEDWSALERNGVRTRLSDYVEPAHRGDAWEVGPDFDNLDVVLPAPFADLNAVPARWLNGPLRIMATAFGFDANGDGAREIYVRMDNHFFCSNGVSVCAYFILSAGPQREVVGDGAGHCLVLGDLALNGWRDVEIRAVSGSDYFWRGQRLHFDGARYVAADSRVLGPHQSLIDAGDAERIAELYGIDWSTDPD